MLIGGSPTTLTRLSAAGSQVLDDALRDGEVSSAEAPATLKLLARLERSGLLIAAPVPLGPDAVRTLLEDLTVVVPVRDDAEGLAALLATLIDAERAIGIDDDDLASNRCLAATRCLVVDDGSVGSDVIAGVAQRFGAELIIRSRSGGPGAARMIGLDAVTTSLVAFLDADVRVTPDWLAAISAHFAEDAADTNAPNADLALAGPRVAAQPGDPVGSDPLRAEKVPNLGTSHARNAHRPRAGGSSGSLHVIERYERRHSPLDLGPIGGAIAPGARLAYAPSAAWVARVEAVRSVGGFDPDLRYGEDVDLIWRLVEAGWTARYEPRSVVYHRTRPTARAWAEQRVRYGTSAAPLAVRHPGSLAPVAVSAWSLIAWSAVGLGHPGVGVGLGAGSTAVLARRLKVANPGSEALRLAGRGNLLAGPQLARGLIRPWWPITLALAFRSPRWRRLAFGAVAASVGHGLVQGRQRPPVARDGDVARSDRSQRPQWVRRARSVGFVAALAVADDVAYSAGVWWGVAMELRHRPRTAYLAVGALLPRVGGTGAGALERLRSARKRGETR